MSENGNGHEASPATTVFEARAEWDCLISLNEAVTALGRSYEMMTAAFGVGRIGASAPASLGLLLHAARGLMAEMVDHFVSLKTAPDPEVRAFVQLVVDRLRTAPATPTEATEEKT